jgi:3-hydroxybutyryl-CoA dehydratase
MITDWYENISVGDTTETRGRTITEADVVNFAMISGDWHPLHVDQVYSESGPFGRRIAHGMLVLTVMTGLIELAPKYVVAFYGFDKVRFARPTFLGDTLRAHTEVVERSDHPRGGVVNCKITVVNQQDEPVAACSMKMLVASKTSALEAASNS